MSPVDLTNRWTLLDGAQGFRKLVAFGAEDPDRVPPTRLVARLREILEELRPAAVAVHGWGKRSALALMHAALAERCPLVMMSDSTAGDAPRRWHKELAKRRIVRLASSAFVAGTPQQEYLVSLGVRSERISLGYDVVDNAHFAAGAFAARQSSAELRARLGLSRPFFLASARFLGMKNLFRLLDAFARYRRRKAEEDAWELVLLGDGELRPELLRHREALGLEGSVRMPGFKQYDELPSWYGLASAFVLASTADTWGLVVNEAMAAGLPVLVSYRCGCAADLVRDGVNGFTFDPYDVEGLASLMHRTAHGDLDLAAMARAGQAIVATWGPERFAEGLGEAVALATTRPAPAPAPGVFDRALLQALIRRDGSARGTDAGSR